MLDDQDCVNHSSHDSHTRRLHLTYASKRPVDKDTSLDYAPGAGGNTKLHHIPKLQAIPGVEVVKIANRSEESAAKVCKELGVAQASEQSGNAAQLSRRTSHSSACMPWWHQIYDGPTHCTLRCLKHGSGPAHGPL